MANPNGAKGARFEKLVADKLAATLSHREITRARKAGVNDLGDVSGLPWIVIECKDRSPYDIPGALKQAKASAQRKGVTDYVVVVKLRGKSIDEAIFIMPLSQGAQWLAEKDKELLSQELAQAGKQQKGDMPAPT